MSTVYSFYGTAQTVYGFERVSLYSFYSTLCAVYIALLFEAVR